MIRNGTRERDNLYKNHPETRFPNNRYRTDVGLKMRLIVSATFSGSTLTDAASDFVAAGFEVNDQIIIWGSASNNGVRTVTAVATTQLTCDFPFVTEGPTSNVEVRNT